MRVLITGGQGMLGYALSTFCTEQNILAFPLGKIEADITNFKQIKATIERYKPTHLINAAAYTKVDLAETERELAFSINATGAKHLAEICWKQNIKFLHLSTDYVFDGYNATPYLENDPINPLSIYGKSKAQGEIWVQEENPKAQIVRLQALYGENGSHFVQTMLNLSQKYSEIQVVNDQVTSPSYTKHIARALLELIQIPTAGIFHLHNQGSCSWYEFATEIFSISKKMTSVKPVTTDHFPRPAARPLHSNLSMERWKQTNLNPLPDWKQAVQEYLYNQNRI